LSVMANGKDTLWCSTTQCNGCGYSPPASSSPAERRMRFSGE
jgi:hypothetical protein